MKYVAAWVAVGAVAAGLVILLLQGTRDEVTLPPVEQTELSAAASDARCRLRRGAQAATDRPRVEGPAGTPARPGAYGRAQSDDRLVAAMRSGAVVIQYRADLAQSQLEQLEELQRAVPRATILVPQPRMPYRFAATAWRRLLGCQQLSRQSIDAIRLFRGRYVGQGPDTRR